MPALSAVTVELLAVSSAFLFAVAVVIVKAGLAGSNAVSAYVVEVIASAAFFTALLPFIGVPARLPLEGVFWIAVGGVTGTLVARVLQIDAIDRMGAALAAPLSNISAIFSSVFAVFFLQERITFLIASGTGLTVLGTVALTYGGGGRKWRAVYALVPIASSLLFGVGTTARKYGLSFIPNSYFDAALNTYAALVGVLLYLLASRYYKKVRLTRRNAGYFSAAGLAYSAALVVLFAALKSGLLVIVGPLAGIVPLFVLVLAAIFLRQFERLTARIILGSMVVVIGIILLSL